MASPAAAEEEGGEIFDVIVVGGGIMGSCAAYQSAKRGLRTLLLEKFEFLHNRGSSHGHSRTIRATYPEPFYPPMVSSSALLWQEAQSESSQVVHFPSPHLDLGPQDDPNLLSVISNSSLSSSFSHPLLHLPPRWLSLLSPLGGILHPSRSLSMFLSLSRVHNAVLKDDTTVISIIRKGKQKEKETDNTLKSIILKEKDETLIVVTTSDGERFRARKCIVTAGAWARKLLEKACGVSVPIVPVETAVWYWRIKEGFEREYSLEGGFPSFAIYGRPYVYGTPSLEYPGLIKISVHGGRECDPDERGGGTEVLMEEMKELVEVVFEGRVDVSGEPVVTQSCMYSMTPDEDFIIDYVGRGLGKDVVVGCGFSGHGFKMAPLVGKMLVEMAMGEREPEEMFRIDRFHGNGVGNPKRFDHQVGLEDVGKVLKEAKK